MFLCNCLRVFLLTRSGQAGQFRGHFCLYSGSIALYLVGETKKEGEEICGRIDHSPSGRKRRENEDSCAVCVRALFLILEEKTQNSLAPGQLPRRFKRDRVFVAATLLFPFGACFWWNTVCMWFYWTRLKQTKFMLN